MSMNSQRTSPAARLSLGECFGIRGTRQIQRDLGEVIRDGLRGKRFQVDWRSAGLLRPDLSLPAYAGVIPKHGSSAIFNLFDRVGGGRHYSQRVTRARQRDFRGGTLSYDEHDGTDFVCPIGTPLVAAAAGRVVAIRDRWLRGGLTIALDHGGGVITQYTHCSRALVEIGQEVPRGTPVALSGASGLDMTQFFPWVPPHVHFMVWVQGVPADPFLATGEADRPGTWRMPNTPLPAAGDSESIPPHSPVCADGIERAALACQDPMIQGEIAAARAHGLPALAALLEDALHHDAWAFPALPSGTNLRPAGQADNVKLSLPFPSTHFRSAYFADTRFTRPRPS